jgi:hypothetical protein
MELIIHRINRINDLKKIPPQFGCEIDLRTNGSRVILNHEPFAKGDNFIDYLDEYKNGTLILNIKESGIEDFVLKEVKKREIKSYFLLDVEIPYLISTLKTKEKNIAIRFSEYETVENVMTFKDKFDWLWIDTINMLPLTSLNKYEFQNFKSILVCPSRWGRSFDIKKYKAYLKEINFNLFGVMTELKYVNNWLT